MSFVDAFSPPSPFSQTLCVVFGVSDGSGVKLRHDALQMTLTTLAYLAPEASFAAAPVLFSDL